ncbi:MAG: V-type ATPase subunit [Treponema sp.]|nr:V-type ATPase subunit [Treponema sp.]
MDRDGARAFVYAKACGVLGKSFTGEKASRLFEQKSLTDLWNLLFKTTAPLIPEVVLAQKIEEESFNRFISQYVDFIAQFDSPETYLSDQFFIYEVENLKEVIDALCAGEKKIPNLLDLGKYTTLHFDQWPNLEKITAGTEYSWLKELPDIHHQQEVEFKLDIQAVKHLWTSISEIKGEEGEAVKNLFLEELILQNIVWALRLKLNFGMSKEEVIPHLMYVTEKPSSQDPLCSQAIKVLDKDPENYEHWINWNYKDLVNPKTDVIWRIEPSWIEKKSKVIQNKKASRLFHCYPVTSASLIGWFKLKQFELSCIRMAVEGLRLNEKPELEY